MAFNLSTWIGRFCSRLALGLWKVEVFLQVIALKLQGLQGASERGAGTSLLNYKPKSLESGICSIHDVREALNRNGSAPLLLDATRIVSGYGYGLADSHPLVLELFHPGFLEVYFKNFQPCDEQEAWFPKFSPRDEGFEEGLVTDRSIRWLPWLLEEGKFPTNDIIGSGLGHGSQFRGPISRINLRREQFRVNFLLNKIRAEGYNPDNYGHISGQFLEKDGDWLFVVLGGNHRSAVLRRLGYSRVPVTACLDIPGGKIVHSGLLRNEHERYAFDALFSRYGSSVRNVFLQSCLDFHRAKLS